MSNKHGTKHDPAVHGHLEDLQMQSTDLRRSS
jgi:hypothetical protein